MRIIYTRAALRQLAKALDYIDERSPQGAQRVKSGIHRTIDLLARHPLAGRATDMPGQRRMLVRPYPYAIFYRVTTDAVVILRVRHTARNPAEAPAAREI